MYEKMFDGTLREHKSSNNTLKLKEDAKPFHAKLFPYQRLTNQLLRKNMIDYLK